MDEAMQFAKVTGSKVEYFELRCGEAQAQIPMDDSMYLEVGDEPFVCLHFQNKELCAFIAKSTELRGYTGSKDRLSDFRGMCELRELRNSCRTANESLGPLNIFGTAKKQSPQKQTDVKWPTTINVGLKLEDWPDVRLLSRRARDNEYVWVHVDDIGVIISFIKLKGLSTDVKRSRHDLPRGIQARKKVKAGVEHTYYVVATRADGDVVTYPQFPSFEDAMAHKLAHDNA